jgi:hypothetical protein
MRTASTAPRLASGDRALGKMQVNSVHLPELTAYGITREHLMTECGSVFVGAWIFARYIALAGPTWQAVGFYNTGPKSTNYAAQARYIAKVKRQFQRIQQNRPRTAVPGPMVTTAMAVWGSP